MTDKSDDSVPESNSNDSNPEQERIDSLAANQDAKSEAGDMPTDELPEEEELTPELIEEEAIRGDFMLRWAAIFLTVLFGFSLIADTQVLTLIRSGESLVSNGLLPNHPDQLSYAAPQDKALSNTTWLFDIILAQVYAIGGATGLTIMKVAIAGLIAWLLSQISVRMMPTWWNSICCVLAAAAFCVDLLPITDIVTLLGLAITLLWLHRSSEGLVQGLHWKLPLLIAVWANLDSRAYLGTFAVALFALGWKMTTNSSDASDSNDENQDSPKLRPGMLAFVCLLALFVNPFPIASGLSAITTYTVEYPNLAAMKTIKLDVPAIQDGRSEFHSLLSSEVWHSFEFSYLAGVCLLVISLIVLLLNRSRKDLPWAMTLAGFFLLTLFAVRELPAAALVAAVVAGTSAQRWYGKTFRQEYSIDTAEVMFSRGGRAVTVLGMALLGFCVVADRLPTRTAIGFGFDPQLQATISSFSDQLSDIPKEDHLLNTRLELGDLLVWDGRQSFADSRARLFGRRDADASTMRHFEELRHSLLKPPEKPEPKQGEVAEISPTEMFYNAAWKRTYDEYEIKQVMIRLCPPGRPAYSMVMQFNQAPEWVPASRGAAAALFRFSSLGNEPPDFSLRDVAFKEDTALTEEDLAAVGRFDFAQPPSFYQKYLYLERPVTTAAYRDAEHIMNLDTASDQFVAQVAVQMAGDPGRQNEIDALGHALAGPLVAIRRANQSLAINPNDKRAFQIQAIAYQRLAAYEAVIAQVGGGLDLSNLRYFQSLTAMHQSLKIDPQQPGLSLTLANTFEPRGRIDLALMHLQNLLEQTGDELLASEEGSKRLEELYTREANLLKAVEEVTARLAEMPTDQFPDDPLELAQQHYGVAAELNRGGFVLKALEYMQTHDALLQPLTAARVLKGQLLFEAGELEEAFVLLNGIAKLASDPKHMAEFTGENWQFPVAMTHIGKAAYAEATSVLQARSAQIVQSSASFPPTVANLLRTLPLIPAMDAPAQLKVAQWPLLHLASCDAPMTKAPTAEAEMLLHMAVLNLEAGLIDDAKQQLTDLIRQSGRSQFRPLAATYLLQFGDEGKKALLESHLNVYSDFEFPELPENQPEDSEDETKVEPAADNADKKAAETTTEPVGDATLSEEKPDPKKSESEKPEETKPEKAKPDNSKADQPAEPEAKPKPAKDAKTEAVSKPKSDDN